MSPTNFTDLTFVCADGSIAAHRAYLSVNCSLVDNFFKARQDYDDNDVTIILPEVRVETVQKFLEILYTGSAVFDNDEGLEELDIFGSLILGFSVAMFWNTTISSAIPGDDHEVDEVTDLTTDDTLLEVPALEDIADVAIATHGEDAALTSKANELQRANHNGTSANTRLPMNTAKGNSFGCRYCSKMFCSPIELAFHVKTDHHFVSKGESMELGKASTPAQPKGKPSRVNALDLTRNGSSENLESKKMEFSCSYCSRMFRSVIELALHVKTEHNHLLTPNIQMIKAIGKRRQPKPDRKENLISNKRAKKWDKNETATGKVVYPCHHCPKTFPLLSILKLHLKHFHTEKSNEMFRAQRANKKSQVVRGLKITETGRHPDCKSSEMDHLSLVSNHEGSLPKRETRGRKPMPKDENGRRIIKRRITRKMKRPNVSKMAEIASGSSGCFDRKIPLEKDREKDDDTNTLGLLAVAVVTLEKLSFCKFCENYFENREQLNTHISSNHRFGHQF